MLDHRIDTFLTLCGCMSYRKTAELCHLSQPAVTQQIQYLERLYGRKLFRYENHHLEKTDEGLLLERYARAAKLQERALRRGCRSGGFARCAWARPRPSATTSWRSTSAATCAARTTR